MKHKVMEDTRTLCKRCGVPVELAQFGKHYKYVSVGTGEWKCLPTAEFPVRSHDPV